MPEYLHTHPHVADLVGLIIIAGALLTFIVAGVKAVCDAIGTIDGPDPQESKKHAEPDDPSDRVAGRPGTDGRGDADHPERPALALVPPLAEAGTAPEEPGQESGRSVGLDEDAPCCGPGDACTCADGCECGCTGCVCEAWGDDQDGDATAVWARSLHDQAVTGRHGKPDADPETDALDVLAAQWEQATARRALLDGATATDDLLARADAVLAADRHLRLAGV